VVEQMNDLIKDHRAFGYLTKVEYRAIKEPDQDVDFIIRYYPGDGARESVKRIRSYQPRGKRAAQQELPLPKDEQPQAPSPAAPSRQELEPEALLAKLTGKPPEGFGVSEAKARELIKGYRQAVEDQIAAYPYRERKNKTNVAGWLIKAIENNYELPQAYLEEKARIEELKHSQEKRTAREACQLCDSMGFRYLGGNRGVKKCSHDPDIEAKNPSP
jgi:hypothetical protein